MIDQTRTTPENGKPDALFDVFGGINEGYVANMLEGDSEVNASNGSDGFKTDLEYRRSFDGSRFLGSRDRHCQRRNRKRETRPRKTQQRRLALQFRPKR